MVVGTDCRGSSESKLYFKDILLKIVTAAIRSQPVLNSQTSIQIFTRESCYILWFVLICFNCLESAVSAYGVLVYISHVIRYIPKVIVPSMISLIDGCC